jgi:hypothetical protein
MTAFAAPTMTRGLTASERRAFAKAIAGNLASTVRRLDRGLYEVPSTTDASVTYIVCGVQAREMTCTCVAGTHGKPCKHVCAVLLRRTQETAMAQARKLAKRAPGPIDPWTAARRAAQRAHGAAAYLRSKQWGADMPTSNAE